MKTSFQLSNGVELPAIGFGTWRATGEEAQQAVRTAIECGYRLIDTAAVYKNEAFVGNAINDCLSRGVVRREELYVTSKVWNTCRGYDKTIAAFRQTLADLRFGLPRPLPHPLARLSPPVWQLAANQRRDVARLGDALS